MSVRICFGITQLGRNTILKLFGDEMLQSFRLFMDFVPGIIENVMQKAFEQPVVANHFQSAFSAGSRKAYPVLLFITHGGGALPRQLLEHSRYGSRAYSEPFRKRIARHPGCLQRRSERAWDKAGLKGSCRLSPGKVQAPTFWPNSCAM